MLKNYQSVIRQVIEARNDIKAEKNDNLLPIWMAWYSGYYQPFHQYYIWNGSRRVYTTKKTLRMAKRVCEDWASLLMSEKVDIVISDKEKLHVLLNNLKFWTKANRAVEVGFALSYSALVVDLKNLQIDEQGNIFPSEKTKMQLSYYRAGMVVPITFENGEVVECAFAKDTKQGLFINAHVRDEDTGEYHILIYTKDKTNNDKETCYDFNTRSKTPFFSIIEPNIENNLSIDTDYPISIFANAIDTLKALDNKYDAFDNEFVLGKKRLFVSSEFTAINYSKDKDGNEITEIQDVFDPNDTSIYKIPQSSDGKNLIYSPNDPLRAAEMTAGINAELKILSNKVGLGNDYYNFEKGSVVTATQVISEKSDTFRNLKKHELLLESALRNIVKAIVYCNNNFTSNEKLSEDEPVIIFDDSIIEDRESEKTSDRQDLTNGVLSKVEYRQKWYGEDEETAKQKIYEINGRNDFINRANQYLAIFNAGLMTAKMFVNLTYTDEDLKSAGITREELINELGLQDKQPNTEITKEDIEAGGYYQPDESEIREDKQNE